MPGYCDWFCPESVGCGGADSAAFPLVERGGCTTFRFGLPPLHGVLDVDGPTDFDLAITDMK